MKKIKYLTALTLSKLAVKLIKLRGKSKGTSAPGMLAMKISPDFITQASKYNNEKIITVTGTNGKTTTTGLIAHIMKQNNKKVVHNTEGANMLTGIATALVNNVSLNTKSDYLIFETDEAYLTKLYNYVDVDCLLITNLFRDQLDRYGEADTTYKKIKEAISKNKNLKVFINADDPSLENIADDNEKIYFGLESVEYAYSTNELKPPADNNDCHFCGKSLIYNKVFYAHVGHFSCECGYCRKTPDYRGFVKVFETYSDLKILHSDKEYNFKINMPGLYNVYNALGAISMALELGVSEEIINQSLQTYSAIFGRAEITTINGKKALVQLIKNPVGASEVIRQTKGFSNSQIVIILNDEYADGRDISWIWDTDFDTLKDTNKNIILSGSRAYDAAIRLKYAGINQNLLTIEKDVKLAIEKACENTLANETMLIFPTYTALLKMQNIFPKKK